MLSLLYSQAQQLFLEQTCMAQPGSPSGADPSRHFHLHQLPAPSTPKLVTQSQDKRLQQGENNLSLHIYVAAKKACALTHASTLNFLFGNEENCKGLKLWQFQWKATIRPVFLEVLSVKLHKFFASTFTTNCLRRFPSWKIALRKAG